MSGTLLSLRNLSVGYGGRSVVSGITAEIVPGELFCLIGPNGAGKSTLLRTLTRELPAIDGEILLEGRPLERWGEKELAKKSAALLTGRPEAELMRCVDVVAAGRYPYTGMLGILGPEDRRVVRQTMEQVRVTGLAEQDFSHLSDGQRQRVLLARALCQQPRLLLLDEPTSFLDIRYKLEFMGLLRRLAAERGIAVVLSLHELELVGKYADRVLCIRDGRAAPPGKPDELLDDDGIRTLFDIDRESFAFFFGKQ